MFNLTLKLLSSGDVIKELVFRNKFSSMAVIPILSNKAFSSLLYSLVYRARAILVVVPIFFTFMVQANKKDRLEEENEIEEMKTSEIKEMLDRKFRSRVIVPIESIDEESISALSFATNLSSDVTAFCICSDEQSCRKIKEDFSLLDSDIKLVIEFSTELSPPDQLQQYIESQEYNFMSQEVISIILPGGEAQSSWGKLSQDHKTICLQSEQKSYEIVVMNKIPSEVTE